MQGHQKTSPAWPWVHRCTRCLMLSTRSLRAVNATTSFLMTAIALHLLSKRHGQTPVVTGESWGAVGRSDQEDRPDRSQLHTPGLGAEGRVLPDHRRDGALYGEVPVIDVGLLGEQLAVSDDRATGGMRYD